MSDAKIYCLVRGSSYEEAEQKLRRSMDKYQLGKNIVEDKERVVVVPGDLAEPNLKIDPSTYDVLCETVDCILHCGAHVHHLYNYEMMRTDNVLGTLEILKLAATKKNKHLHNVSTLSAVAEYHDENDWITEDFPAENGVKLDGLNGYAQTKLAAEILLGKAFERGMSVFTYRPTWIIGHSTTGAFAFENNHLFLLMKGCLQLGGAPVLDAKLNLIPVDTVSSFIVKTALENKLQKRVFNLISPINVDWNDVIRRLNDNGYKIDMVSPSDWQKKYLSKIDEWNALYPLMSLYLDGGVQWAAMQNIPFQSDTDGATLNWSCLDLGYEKILDNVIRIYHTFFGR
ncbi:MAG: thioester reductase domain-containing protein, partial [Holosporaceae bacterium]|jgi:thioester reductase-like protein|nr:thioester reductase domain-containing protein [Holosporaceae bacterium]